MRDRLIEILKMVEYQYTKTHSITTQNVADFLLKRGVDIPPCKVGDVVYFVARNSGKPIGAIDEIKIVMFGKTENGYCAKGKIKENTLVIIPRFEIDNYTFFDSKEKAVQALNKLSK